MVDISLQDRTSELEKDHQSMQEGRTNLPFQVRLLLDLHDLERCEHDFGAIERIKMLEADLDPALLKRYRKVKAKRGTGVSIMKNGTCTGCHLNYPKTHEFRQCTNFVHTCEYCGRLLVALDEKV